MASCSAQGTVRSEATIASSVRSTSSAGPSTARRRPRPTTSRYEACSSSPSGTSDGRRRPSAGPRGPKSPSSAAGSSTHQRPSRRGRKGQGASGRGAARRSSIPSGPARTSRTSGASVSWSRTSRQSRLLAPSIQSMSGASAKGSRAARASPNRRAGATRRSCGRRPLELARRRLRRRRASAQVVTIPRPRRASSARRRCGAGVGFDAAGVSPVPFVADDAARGGTASSQPARTRAGSSMRPPSVWRRPRLRRASRGQSSTQPVARTATSARHSSGRTVSVGAARRVAAAGGGRTAGRRTAGTVATGTVAGCADPVAASEVPAVARSTSPAIAPAQRDDHDPVSSDSWRRRALQTPWARLAVASAQAIPAAATARCAHAETDPAGARADRCRGTGARNQSRTSASGTPTTRTAALARAARPVLRTARGALIRCPWGSPPRGTEPAGRRRRCRAGPARARWRPSIGRGTR